VEDVDLTHGGRMLLSTTTYFLYVIISYLCTSRSNAAKVHFLVARSTMPTPPNTILCTADRVDGLIICYSIDRATTRHQIILRTDRVRGSCGTVDVGIVVQVHLNLGASLFDGKEKTETGAATPHVNLQCAHATHIISSTTRTHQ